MAECMASATGEASVAGAATVAGYSVAVTGAAALAGYSVVASAAAVAEWSWQGGISNRVYRSYSRKGAAVDGCWCSGGSSGVEGGSAGCRYRRGHQQGTGVEAASAGCSVGVEGRRAAVPGTLGLYQRYTGLS